MCWEWFSEGNQLCSLGIATLSAPFSISCMASGPKPAWVKTTERLYVTGLESAPLQRKLKTILRHHCCPTGNCWGLAQRQDFRANALVNACFHSSDCVHGPFPTLSLEACRVNPNSHPLGFVCSHSPGYSQQEGRHKAENDTGAV